MKHIKNLIIETERLVLVPITMAHAGPIFKEFTPEITALMYPKSPDHISETEKFITESIEKMDQWTNYQATILDKDNGEFIGCCGLHKIDTTAPEPGIRIRKSAHGKKLGREAVQWLTDRAQENLEFNYLFYPVDKDNIPSRKIAESLWWILQVDADGNEIVTICDTADPGRKFNGVEYRVYKKAST